MAGLLFNCGFQVSLNRSTLRCHLRFLRCVAGAESGLHFGMAGEEYREFFDPALYLTSERSLFDTCDVRCMNRFCAAFHVSTFPNYAIGQTRHTICAAAFAETGLPWDGIATGPFVKERSCVVATA